MATISKSWGSDTYIEATDSTYTTLSGTTEEYSSDVDLETDGYEGAVVTAEVDFDATPTDDVIVSVYASLDGSNYDTEPLFSFTIDNGTDPAQVSFVVTDVPHFRLGIKQTGSTDSHDVRAHYQPWRWQSA